MSPERKAIIDAINMGNRTTSLIALAINKSPQTVAKMVSKLKKLEIILVDNSGCFYIPVDNNVDSNVDISTPKSTPVDNSILVRLNSIENNIAILTQKNTDSNQQFEQLKKELLSEIKKSSSDSQSVESLEEKLTQLRREKVACENEAAKQKEGVKVLLSKVDKLESANVDLLHKNQNNDEIIEHLQADIKRLEEAKEVSHERNKKAEKERDEALDKVVKLDSENTKLRSKLEAVGTTEPEQNDSKNEPENEPEIKFTLKEAKARFFELRKKFPYQKQSELIRILDSEGYKNKKGKQLVPSTVSRWHEEWEEKAG